VEKEREKETELETATGRRARKWWLAGECFCLGGNPVELRAIFEILAAAIRAEKWERERERRAARGGRKGGEGKGEEEGEKKKKKWKCRRSVQKVILLLLFARLCAHN